MKTSAVDFLISGLCIALIAAVALIVTVSAVAPYSRQAFGAYHVIVDGFFFLLSYGLLSAVFLRLLLWMRPLRPGEYSMDHPHFAYWKLFTAVYEFGRFALLPFTTVFARPLVAALFGAEVGRNRSEEHTSELQSRVDLVCRLL